MKKSLSFAAILSMGGLAIVLAQSPMRPHPVAVGMPASKQFLYAPADRVGVAALEQVMRHRFEVRDGDVLVSKGMQTDELGYTHHRFQQYHLGYPVEGGIQKAHVFQGKIASLNGYYYPNLLPADVRLTADDALQAAIRTSGAEHLIWQSPGADKLLQAIKGDALATWMPKPTLVYTTNRNENLPGSHRLAWKVDIYNVQPLFRADIYIDAATGVQINRNELLHTTDSPGSAHTRYSGVRAIVTDSTGPYYRLRETGRALGVETYDMLHQTDYQMAVDVTQFDNIWDSFPSVSQRGALDAHWGAEMTYDFYHTFFNRESYDDSSSKLISYVGYDNNYSNAFWNGIFMTYGDGGGNNAPFSGLDVCGHEFTHGVTQFSAGLVYQDEPGALNESFSDIFGNSIEFWARPNQASWLIGDDIGAFRSMSDPKAYFNPDTYQGSFWSSPGGFDNGGVHNNSGVQNYWYYLLCAGGSGINDNQDSYSVTGVGLLNGAQIAYRNLHVYLTPNSGFADARIYSIQSAIDLFGECSPEMIATMNAWYACGVGNPYTGTLAANFYTADTNLCQTPSDVHFQNFSLSAIHYFWDFGDGSTSTDENPVHSYQTPGDYTVTLLAYGCNGSVDTLVFPNRIHIDLNQPCTVNMPVNGDTLLITSCDGFLFDTGGAGDYLPNSNSRTTITPAGNQQVQLSFQSFDYAAGDRVTVFDGPTTSSPQIGLFTGTTLPPTLTSTNGSLTIYESTNGANNHSGFWATWGCVVANSPLLSQSAPQVFPNPTTGKVKLNWAREVLEPRSYTVCDAMGRVVMVSQRLQDGSWEEEIDLSQFPRGMYILQLRAGDDQHTLRIIVQ